MTMVCGGGSVSGNGQRSSASGVGFVDIVRGCIKVIAFFRVRNDCGGIFVHVIKCSSMRFGCRYG